MSQVAMLPVRRPLVPSAVLGMLAFVVTEVMFFAGLVSAFLIVRSRAVTPWPPVDQPRLPIEATAVNTLVLMLSGLAVFVAWRELSRGGRCTRWLVAGVALGAVFVSVQGAEWLALLREGLTLTTSAHASFFYVIVGSHALHVFAALGVLSRTLLLLRANRLVEPTLRAATILWTFVVGVWPVLYSLVYLGAGA